MVCALTISVLISGHPMRVMKWVSESQQETPVQRAGQAADSAVEELRALWPKLSASVQEFLGEEAQEPEHQEGAAAPAEPTDSEHSHRASDSGRRSRKTTRA
ncbi:head maturation protease [Pseudomonas phage WP1]